MSGRDPRHVMRTSEFGRVWGDDVAGDPTAFTTIAVPIEYRAVLGMNFLRPQMEWLYMVLGSYYRNFVLFRWYNNYPKHEVPAALLNMHLPDLIQRHSYPYWKYCKDVWRRCPNIISVDQIDAEFAEFYKQNLTEFTGKMKSLAVSELEDSIYELMVDPPPRIDYGTTRGTSVDHLPGQADIENRRESGR